VLAEAEDEKTIENAGKNQATRYRCHEHLFALLRAIKISVPKNLGRRG
jgi:hypothetical protein